ncbi:response regulator [Acidisoma sp. L85]|uniref:response regulator n=1 Tax=Acidisoma sp. L85 TaxID=1641850 RepID=UPI0020B108E8|nr:response regulator [Acidisoma sp. L85]
MEIGADGDPDWRTDHAGHAWHLSLPAKAHDYWDYSLVKGLRILVVEDDAIVGILIAEMLVAMGHEVCALETNEADAVAAAARHRPGLMIVDRQLREGNGGSAVQTILKSERIPHLFITGSSRRDPSFPTSVVLRKPFREPDLVEAIGRALAM